MLAESERGMAFLSLCTQEFFHDAISAQKILILRQTHRADSRDLVEKAGRQARRKPVNSI